MKATRLGGFLAILLALGTQAAACTSSTSTPATSSASGKVDTYRTTPVTGAPVQSGAVPAAAVNYSGDVRAKTQVTVAAKTMGRIDELNAEVGARVQAGEVIGHLERTILEAQLLIAA